MIIKTYPVGDLQTNCYIIADEATHLGVIVDPGAEPKTILEAVKADGLQIKAMLATHGHFDHIGAAQDLHEILGVPLWCHKLDEAMAINAVAFGAMFNVRVDRAPQKVDFYLEDGKRIDVGALSFEVLHTPGHTPGGITLVCGKHAFTGDTLFAGGMGRTDLDGGSHSQIISSITDKLYALDDDIRIYPGHGPTSTIGWEKRNNPYLRF